MRDQFLARGATAQDTETVTGYLIVRAACRATTWTILAAAAVTACSINLT